MLYQHKVLLCRGVCLTAIGPLLIAFSLLASSASAQSDPIFTAAGFKQNHDYFSGFPEEQIDTNTGALILSATDLVLPGNGGHDIHFRRTYNSKTGQWTFGIAGVPVSARFEPLPLNNAGGAAITARTLWTADDGAHYALYPGPGCNTANCRYFYTKEFWLMDTVDRRVYMPDGTINFYASDGSLIESRDVFGNRFTISKSGSTTTVRQYFANKQNYREVKIEGQAGKLLPASMTFDDPSKGPTDDPTWSYVFSGPVTDSVLRVTSPENTTWEYRSVPPAIVSVMPFMVTSIKTPSGGIVSYEYEDFDTLIPNCGSPPVPNCTNTVKTPVVKSRTTNDPVANKTWTYTYPAPNDSSTPSRVKNPDGTVIEFMYTTAGSATDELGGQIETAVKTRRVLASEMGPALETEERTYDNIPITSVQIAQGFNRGSQVLKSVSLIRDGVTYTTTNTFESLNFGDYHRPKITVESSSPNGLSRTTTRSFVYEDADLNRSTTGDPMILGKLSSEVVEVAGVQEPSYTTSWQYDSHGFKISETVFVGTAAQRTTTFTPDGYGNVKTITNPNGELHKTTFDYDWGVVSQIATPKHTTSRVINADSTVKSQTQAGRTTTFEYDKLLRIKKSIPPEGAEVVTDYATDSVTVTRGASKTRMALDGFGRVVETEIETGPTTPKVRTESHYDAMGRKTKESSPFYQGDVKRFTTYTYDGLGRVTETKHPDDKTVVTQYSVDPANGSVGIKNERDIWSVQNWKGFGSPDDARLVSVTDAYNFTWHYAYNGLGKLVRVDAPDSVVRTWEYDGDLLKKEVHPESGETTYTYYPDGSLKTKKDARNTEFKYYYDLNERVERIEAGIRISTFTYEQGSDNRETAAVDNVTSTYAYDGSGRLKRRIDSVSGEPQSYSQEFTYHDRDNLQKVTYATDREVEYSYDSANRVTRVYDKSRSLDLATNFSYHPSGALTSYKSGNNVVHDLQYDPTAIGRPKSRSRIRAALSGS
jgi:YD repeat-containing protein